MNLKCEINQEVNDTTIKITKENHSIDDLKQKLINDLYEKESLEGCKNEIDLLTFLYSPSYIKD